MKKLLLLVSFFVLLLGSCSTDTKNEEYTYEVLPVSQVLLPSVFKVNEENEIQVSFLRPSTCYAFDSFYYDIKGNIRTIAVESLLFSNNNCTTLTTNNTLTKSLMFTPNTTGNYTLKFWNGKDTNGNDTFLTYEIVVEN